MWISLIPTPRWLGLIPTPPRGSACHSPTRVPTKFVVLNWIRRNTTADILLRPHLKLQTIGICYWEGQTDSPAHAYKLFNVVIRPAWKIFVATGLGRLWGQVQSFEVKLSLLKLSLIPEFITSYLLIYDFSISNLWHFTFDFSGSLTTS
jgi:hypothetical protein